ncbi:hypothetical protein AO269_23255 [Pseudomonas putida]|nr:hypothetical protein AO269_23255 [Pseudomonas putida]
MDVSISECPWKIHLESMVPAGFIRQGVVQTIRCDRCQNMGTFTNRNGDCAIRIGSIERPSTYFQSAGVPYLRGSRGRIDRSGGRKLDRPFHPFFLIGDAGRNGLATGQPTFTQLDGEAVEIVA